MSALTILADAGALLVLMWATYVVVRFALGYPGHRADEWERENVGGRR